HRCCARRPRRTLHRHQWYLHQKRLKRRFPQRSPEALGFRRSDYSNKQQRREGSAKSWAGKSSTRFHYYATQSVQLTAFSFYNEGASPTRAPGSTNATSLPFWNPLTRFSPQCSIVGTRLCVGSMSGAMQRTQRSLSTETAPTPGHTVRAPLCRELVAFFR